MSTRPELWCPLCGENDQDVGPFEDFWDIAWHLQCRHDCNIPGQRPDDHGGRCPWCDEKFERLTADFRDHLGQADGCLVRAQFAVRLGGVVYE